jgi:hypothetical protein
MRLRGWLMMGMLALGLGCGGALDAVADLAGVEMKMGADSVHPADFPVSAPAGATPMFSVALVTEGDSVELPAEVDVPLDETARYRTEMITYQVPKSAVGGLIAAGQAEAEAAGFELKPFDEAKSSDADVRMFAKGDTMFLVVGTQEADGDESALVLMRIRPADDAPAE